MANGSLIPELENAEAALARLCEAVVRKTQSKEVREDYASLCNQATAALNKIRAITETQDFLESGLWQSKLDGEAGGR